MCIRDSINTVTSLSVASNFNLTFLNLSSIPDFCLPLRYTACLLYTSDAADERSSVDLGGRRIIKKKKIEKTAAARRTEHTLKTITQYN